MNTYKDRNRFIDIYIDTYFNWQLITVKFLSCCKSQTESTKDQNIFCEFPPSFKVLSTREELFTPSPAEV